MIIAQKIYIFKIAGCEMYKQYKNAKLMKERGAEK
jgi:hypothetical protein